MNTIIKATFSLFGMLLAAGAFAQCMVNSIPDSDKFELAESVFQGRVLDFQSNLNNEDGHIYTTYTIEVLEATKGEMPGLVKLNCRGGRWGNLTEVIRPGMRLSMGAEGTFFVKRSKELLEVKEDAIPLFIPVFGAASFTSNSSGINLKPSQQSTLSNRMAPPVINSISPSAVTAGTGKVITISGENFGDDPVGFATFQLRNPDIVVGAIAFETILPNHIISWSDEEIQVVVPGRDIGVNTAGAGSGAVRIINPFGEGTTSDEEFTVRYNRFVQGFENISLTDDNGEGGFTFSIHEDILNNTPAVEALERAMDAWRCSVRTNFILASEATSANCPSNDGVNLISFDDNCDLPIGTLAQTSQWFMSCPDGNEVFLEMDLIINKEIPWHFGTSDALAGKYDFESLIIHELGHSHGFGHSLDSLNVMYSALSPGETRRTLDSDTEEGGHEIIAESTTIGTCGNSAPMVMYPVCASTTKNPFEAVGFQLNPNPTNGLMEIMLTGNYLTGGQIFFTDLAGRTLSKLQIAEDAMGTALHVDIGHFPSGIYYVSYLGGEHYFTKKIIKY